MHDLLNEKEFVPKLYNPWKLFYTFYVIAFIQIVLFIAVSLIYVSESGIKSIIVALLLPNLTALAMFFSKKKNNLLSIKTIALATLILFGVYYIPIIGFAIIGGGTITDITIIATVAIGNFLLCFGIMYFVAKSKQRKK